MSKIDIENIGTDEAKRILELREGHFCDLKAVEIKPSKLTHSIAAFANAEGGEIYVGVAEGQIRTAREWRGFTQVEDANGFLQTFEQLFPLGQDFSYEFIGCEVFPGLLLKIDIRKTPDIKHASNGKIYLRRGAQNLPIEDPEGIERLKRNKGLISFEMQTLNSEAEGITTSAVVSFFIKEVIPTTTPLNWLSKQKLIVDNKPTVAGVLLFSDEPQILLPKRSGIKIYRYRTSDKEGSRETLASNPESIEGPIYKQIKHSVNKTAEIIQGVRINTPVGLQSISYPVTALHEIITNAVLHRDYSIADDIHIRIFDNRVEVASPGTLPGHITTGNILDERFARNGMIVRIVNKFPDPPNKDIGEGLNTAFRAMRDMKLKAPVITQEGEYVIVQLKHEPLASPEEIILEYLKASDLITNRVARAICYIGSENQMKRIIQGMVKKGILEIVPGRNRYNAAYKLKKATEEVK